MRGTFFVMIVVCLGWGGAGVAEAQTEAATAWSYCFGTDARQCSVAGRCFLEGTGGTEAVPSRAQLAWQHGCENQDGESCRELGLLYDQGRVFAQSSERAYQQFHQGCQLGSMSSCHEQARLFRLGRGVGQNMSEANRLDTWACEHGSAAACVTMADAYGTGQGVGRNDVESQRLRARACELGEASACQPAAPAAPVAPAPSPTQPGAPVPTAPAGYSAPPAQSEGIAPEVVQAAISSVMGDMTRCYERRSRRVPLSGVVVLHFGVDTAGRATDVTADEQQSTITDAWMRRCVANAGRRMRFAPPPPQPTPPLTRAFAFNQ